MYINFSKRNVSEISFDNYHEKLDLIKDKPITTHENFDFLNSSYESFKSNFCNNILYLEPKFIITSIQEIANVDKNSILCENFQFYYNENEDVKWYDIIDNQNKIHYSLNLNNDNQVYSLTISDENSTRQNQFLKKIVNNILKENNVTIRKSDSDYQIIIKENNDSFTIFKIQGDIENPFSIIIEIYK